MSRWSFRSMAPDWSAEGIQRAVELIQSTRRTHEPAATPPGADRDGPDWRSAWTNPAKDRDVWVWNREQRPSCRR